MPLVNRLKSVGDLALSAFLVIANLQIFQATPPSKVDKFFAAVKSDKPVDIESPQKNTPFLIQVQIFMQSASFLTK